MLSNIFGTLNIPVSLSIETWIIRFFMFFNIRPMPFANGDASWNRTRHSIKIYATKMNIAGRLKMIRIVEKVPLFSK